MGGNFPRMKRKRLDAYLSSAVCVFSYSISIVSRVGIQFSVDESAAIVAACALITLFNAISSISLVWRDKAIAKSIEENEKTILKSIKENEKTIIKTLRAMETTDEAIERLNEENTRLINDLFGYDVKQARILETIYTEILPRYVIDVLGVNESYILEFNQKRLYNPTSGSIAVEWDGILLVDYRDRPASEIRRQGEPEHNTLFLLEAKPFMEAEDVLPKIEKKINATKAAINFDYSTSKLQMGRRRAIELGPQRMFFYANPIIICVAGCGKKDLQNEKAFLEAGLMVISPDGDDFSVSGYADCAKY